MGVKVTIRSTGDGTNEPEIKIRIDGRAGLQVRVRAFARAGPKRERLGELDGVTAAMREVAVRTFLEQGDPVRLGGPCPRSTARWSGFGRASMMSDVPQGWGTSPMLRWNGRPSDGPMIRLRRERRHRPER